MILASTSKVEVVEEREKRETRRFCSKKSLRDAEQQCKNWLAKQSKTLSNRLLTSYCGPSESKPKVNECLYRAVGELKYVLKTYRTETVDK